MLRWMEAKVITTAPKIRSRHPARMPLDRKTSSAKAFPAEVRNVQV